jgi:spore coat protein CotF
MPIQLSQKERMFLQDLKSHEQLCIQKYNKYSNEAQDPQLKQLFQTHSSHEQQHFNTINQILGGQVPSMNQAQGQQAQQQNQAMQSVQGNAMQAQTQTFNQNDADLANDMLSTEKYISGTYDTSIFEFQDANVRKALNHIQKEEQEHGEDLFNYMKSHGMYNVQ